MKTRKKGILFFAVVAFIMLSSGVTIAINPAQWFGDSSDFDEITAELNMINATIAKNRIPFFLVFTVKILNCHVISDWYQHENVIIVLNRQ